MRFLIRLFPRRSCPALAVSAALCLAPAAQAPAQTTAAPTRAAADAARAVASGIPFATRDLSSPALQSLLNGITVTSRVLLIGVNPDDVDPALIAWLTRGHHAETGFLALTRGESGQNYGGTEGGSTLGAIRVDEALAARRIDGAHQFFTRAMDPGPVTSAAQVFNAWPRSQYAGDMVSVIRAFRPQVIIAMVPDSIPDGDGQHLALSLLANDAFTGSGDAERFPAKSYGMPWLVDKLYQYGRGIRIETAALDTASGMTYEQIGMAARAQSRSQGLTDLTKPRSSLVTLKLVASRDSTARADTSLFAGVDTTFARLAAGDTGYVARALSAAAAHTDSARRAFANVSRRAAAPQLALVVRAVTGARDAAARCKHPAADAALVVRRPSDCDQQELDVDAALDIVRHRAVDALLSAADVMLDATSDRELVASIDSATVTVTLANHGSEPVTLADVTTNGRRAPSSIPVVVFPDSVGRIVRHVSGLDEPRPWWISQHGPGGYAISTGFVDGLDRLGASAQTVAALGARGIDVPEDIRRLSDATVTLSVEGTTFRTSIGPILYRHADAQVGFQGRPIAGVPDVTFRFGRALEWLPSGKSITRVLRVAVESHADTSIEVGFAKMVPATIHIDSMPKEFTLAPREARALFVPIHGEVSGEEAVPLSVTGARADGTTYLDGYQTIQRSYLPPIRIFRNSGAWLQPVKVNIPPKLTVIYVPDASDDIRSALTEIGVNAREVSPDELLGTNLSLVSTVVLGPHAFETHPELTAQVGRLIDFVRRGGTLVVQRGDSATLASGLFPYPISLGKVPGRILDPGAPVSPAAAGERLLSWPNDLTPHDWNNWVVDRAELVPTEVDPRYSRIITTHDVSAPPTSNTILTAQVGKGMFVYTTLTLEQQIEGAVPGAMRLLVNLLSAGLSPASR